MEFFTRLLDTSDFPARWTCGRWSPGHGWLHVLSDLAVWSAYFAIPLVFGYFLARRKDLPFRSIMLLFAAFIVLCGTTHLMEAAIFWWPAYRLAGVLKLLTAVVSWLTVFALVRTAPAILSMRSPGELERLVRERTAESEAAVAALRAERELLRTTLISIGDAVITTDAAGRVTDMNPVAETLTGWATAEATGRPLDAVFVIVHEETRRPVENPATRALLERVVVGLANHTVLIAKDGTERPIDDSAAPIRTTEGEIVGCVLVFRDVTERHRQEAALRGRERQFVTLAESIPHLAWMANPDGNIFWYNRRWFDYTGTTQGQMECSGWQSVHDPEELPKVLERWKASVATGQPLDMTFPLKGRDGHFRLFLTRVEPLKDDEGRVVRWFGTNTDITGLRDLERAVRASEERLRLVVDSATGFAIFTMDGGGIVTGWNSGAERLFGFGAGEVVGQHDRVLYVAEDAALGVPEREMQTAAAEGRAVNERWHVRKDGGRFWGSGLVQPLRDDGGVVIGFLKIMRDMTVAKELREKLERQAEDLREADRRKDEFLATLAHELRNPLAPIRNGLQLMRMAGGGASEKTRTMMERQLTQMVRLVDDLMDISRISRGKMDLRTEHVQLAAVLGSAVETSRPLIEEMGHELTVTLPHQPVVVDADLTRLAQVFLNLLNNAAKYSERGGQIRLTAEQQGSDAVVSVRDTGIGIAADQLPHVFEMFTQIDRGLEKARGGLGIGLSLVKRLAEMHGGSIEARSDGPGKGSDFVVRLPVVLEASGPQAADGKDQTSVNSSLRILIVDDNRDAADSLSEMLKVAGNDTRTAYDGQQGVEVADDYRPDVVLMDIGMPKMNGYEAARRIRGEPWGKGLTLVALTGWGQEDDRRKTAEAGFDHHLVKPVAFAAVTELLAGLTGATA